MRRGGEGGREWWRGRRGGGRERVEGGGRERVENEEEKNSITD